MRRGTKLVLAITAMVAVLVTAFSYLYIAEILRQRILQANDVAGRLTEQLAHVATNAAPDLGDTKVDTHNPEALSRGIAYYLSTDRDLNSTLETVVRNWPLVYDAAVVDDADGKAILHSKHDMVGKVVPDRLSFQRVQQTGFRKQLKLVYSPPTVYDVRTPLLLNGTAFGSVRVGISTVFLKSEITPFLQRAIVYCCAAVLLSLILAAGLSRLALGPLERISQDLDSVSAGNTVVPDTYEATEDEYGMVTLKIAHLGRQMRDTKEIFSALKDNVDQIMANLQDGLMLFTRDLRVVLVSASVERFLGRPRRDLLGRTVNEIFSPNTPIGALVIESFHLRRGFAQREVESTAGKRVQLALDFIQEGRAQIGALLTMRDTESVRRIGDEIEASRRLSASGRITRGVAHEVKNPINAIVLHLQLLQNKLQQAEPDTRRHMDIIDNEIHRLDRVVQILVDFTRPRDLRLEQIDFRRVLEDVAQLAEPDAAQHGVTVQLDLPNEPLTATADSDFMKQAVLNVVLNGVQAMPEGGELSLRAYQQDGVIVTEIHDQGAGIPPDLQEKIFELYFTTKKEGSGIGLAQTYQIMQWHYGSVEFESANGNGTTFRLRLPLVETRVETTGSPASTELVRKS